MIPSPDPTPPETAVLSVLHTIARETPLVALLHRNAILARSGNEEAANDPDPEGESHA